MLGCALTYAITCDLTGTTARVACGCPAGHDPAAAGEHHEDCGLHPKGMHAAVGCAGTCCADGDACPNEGHHPQECTAEHGACPDPGGCKLWAGVRSHVPDPDAAGLPRSCPGGHHGYGVPGCVVCHPLTVTFIPGQDERVQLQMAAS